MLLAWSELSAAIATEFLPAQEAEVARLVNTERTDRDPAQLDHADALRTAASAKPTDADGPHRPGRQGRRHVGRDRVLQQRDGDPTGRQRWRTGAPSWMLGHTRSGPATSVVLPDTTV